MHNVEVWGGWGGLGGWGDYGIMHNVEMRWGLRRAGRLWECEDGHYGIMHNVEVWGKWVRGAGFGRGEVISIFANMLILERGGEGN